jgi:signal transduction histidine kinase
MGVDRFDGVTRDGVLRLRDLADAMPVGLVILQADTGDDDGVDPDPRRLRIVAVNPAAAHLVTGIDITAAVGRTIAEALGGRELGTVPERALEVIVAGEARDLGTLENGAGRLLSVSIFPLAGGSAAGVLLDDVTAEHQRERLLERLALAEEEERHRIAVGVHDEPVQRLAAASLRLQSLRGVTGAELDRRLIEIDDLVRDALMGLRRLIFELRPPELDEEGLVAALELAGAQVLDPAATTLTVVAALSREPAAGVQAAVYRVVLEALANVRAHAAAARVTVSLTEAGNRLLVDVLDDGVGIRDGAMSRPGHLGLRTMRERVEATGGTLTIRPATPAGTRIGIRIPRAF